MARVIALQIWYNIGDMMKNADTIRRRIEEVKKLGSEDVHKALCMLAEISYDIGTDACDERAILQKEVNQLRTFIVGNGNPANSILARLTNVETSLAEFTKRVSADLRLIKDAILGDINTGKRGLYNKVEENSKMNANINKIMWAIILIIVGELIGRILGLF